MDTTDNPKSTGLKHFKNKKKNSKHKPSAHSVPPKIKSVTLDSNWDRYEQKCEKKTINSSTDFAILANAPITRGSHFQFKSDKSVDEATTETNNSLELFKLDLNLLEKSLATIPFSSRSGIDDKYFSEVQHKIMETTAKNNNEIYFSYLNTLPKNSLIGPFEYLHLDDEEENETEHNLFDRAKVTCQVPPSQELNEITVREVPAKVDEKDENDLEQWLDSILDE